MKKELLKKFRVGIWGSVVLVLFVTGVVLWWMLHGLFTEPTILTDLGKTLIEGEVSANECTWLVFMMVLPA